MKDADADTVVVVENDAALGVITEGDIVEKVVAAGRLDLARYDDRLSRSSSEPGDKKRRPKSCSMDRELPAVDTAG